MGIANDMKRLGEDIVVSHDLRVKAYDLRVKAIGELVSDVHKTLEGFGADRKKMSKEQNKALTEFVANLTKDVDNLIKGFQKDRKDMAKVLKEDLENYTKGIEIYTANKLKEFSDAHAEMSEELKKGLAKYVNDMIKTTKSLLKDYTEEREKMSANWQKMAATMARKRGAQPKVEAKVKVISVEEAVEEKPKEIKPVKSEVEVKLAEEAVEEVEEGKEEPISIEERILKFIGEHPEGVRVGDMEEPLGTYRTKLGEIAKRLLDKGNLRKEDNLYFPL